MSWKLTRAICSVVFVTAMQLTVSAHAQPSPGVYKGDGSDGREKFQKFMEDKGAGPMEDVKTRIKNQIDEGKADLYTEHQSKVEEFVKTLKDDLEGGGKGEASMKKIDRGFDTPTDFHALDKQIIEGHLDECWDGLQLQDNKCVCFNYVTDPANRIIIDPSRIKIEPMTEYWFPVSKVENVPTPLETGYLKQTEIDNNKDVMKKEWVEYAANRMTKNAKQYWEKNDKLGKVYKLEEDIKIEIPDEYVDKARSITEIDANWRTMYPENSSGMHTDYHVLPEPHGRHTLYWKSRISKYVCHWNLHYGGSFDASGGDINYALKTLWFSDLKHSTWSSPVSGRSGEVKTWEATRNSTEHNLKLTGKDILRPQVEYDHVNTQKGDQLSAYVDNGGYIAMYMTQTDGREENPMFCPESYMDVDFRQITHDKGRTPPDTLKSLWEAKKSTQEDFQTTGGFLSSGCLRKNLGEWVPTRQTAQTIYHSQAAMVGTMRGLKLAYYYFSSDGWSPDGQKSPEECKKKLQGDGKHRFADSYGISPCFFVVVQVGEILGSGRELKGIVPDGVYYDFEPNIYTFAAYTHARTSSVDKDVYWVLRCPKGICPFAADKVQWSNSKAMPKKCIGLQKYFNELEKTFEGVDQSKGGGTGGGVQGGQIWEAEHPNQIELPRDEKNNDPHNVAIQWRFFRTCPKETINDQWIKVKQTNTAVCCQPCPCPPAPPFPGCPPTCIPEKKL